MTKNIRTSDLGGLYFETNSSSRSFKFTSMGMTCLTCGRWKLRRYFDGIYLAQDSIFVDRNIGIILFNKLTFWLFLFGGLAFINHYLVLNIEYIIYIIYVYIIYMVLNTEWILEVAIESLVEWELNPRPLNSVQMLLPAKRSGHEFNSLSEPAFYIYSNFIFSLVFRFCFCHCPCQSPHSPQLKLWSFLELFAI